MITSMLKAAFVGFFLTMIWAYLLVGSVVVAMMTFLRPALTLEGVVLSLVLAAALFVLGVILLVAHGMFPWGIAEKSKTHAMASLLSFCLVLNMWFGAGGLVRIIRF